MTSWLVHRSPTAPSERKIPFVFCLSLMWHFVSYRPDFPVAANYFQLRCQNPHILILSRALMCLLLQALDT